MELKLIKACPITDNAANNNNDLAIVVAIPHATNGENSRINGDKKNKKKRGGSFNLLKAAMLIFRYKPGEKPKSPAIQLDVASKGDWKKIVGSMRPLHLQDNPSPTPSPPQSHAASDDDHHQPAAEQFEDVVIAPVSPTLSSTSTSTGTMSQYASANNLQELDKHRESDDEDEDQVFDNKPADAMIDAKAEEFIAHFYAQMRRQRLDSAHHDYHHHHRRGKRY